MKYWFIATVNLSPFGKQQLVDFPIFKGLAFQHSVHYLLLMCLARGAWKSQSLVLMVSMR